MIKKAMLAAAVAAATVVAASPATAAPPAPLDPQKWSFQDNLTWADYKPLPGPNYADPSIQPTVKKWRVALLMFDYPDKSFTISEPAGSTIYGTPSALAHSIPRAEVPKFYGDFFNTPSALNNFQTINRYWMENSYGKYGVELVPFGPFKLPKKSYQYHLGSGFQQPADCPNPTNDPAERCYSSFLPGQTQGRAEFDYFTAARTAWEQNVPAATRATFDNAYFVSAGQDESATWQEFGEMRFTGPEAVTDPFGPKHIDPLHARGNWASTRYIPWTSWAAASNIWPSANQNVSTEAESSGMAVFAHELSHNLGLPDNYNNPFQAVPQRTAGGMWDMMSRGSFNGPGGQHTRWMIPPTQGAALGAQHGIRNKQKLNFVAPDDVLTLNRGGLAQTGTMVAEVKAREVAPGDDLAGVRVVLNDGGDKNPVCRYQENPMCEGPWYTIQNGQERITPGFDDYTVEVVQQIGSDSFTGGSGVLIGKNKTQSSSCGSPNFNCQTWYIDANPQDINQVDYVKADGTVVKATLGDERQTNDGTFHAGVNSGSEYEFKASNNQLHFYILDKRVDAEGVNRYKIGIRSLAGTGPQTRGVSLSPATKGTAEGLPTCTFSLKNTGTAADLPAGVHPTAEVAKYFNSDIYRLTATSNTTGWTAHLKNALATAEFGQSVDVPVYIDKVAGAPANGSVTLTATSESDPSKTMSTTCAFGAGDTVGGTVPATLALNLGTADFEPFTPGMQKDYYASTDAKVTSTAGDATLSVADPSTTAAGHLVNGAFVMPEKLQVNAVRGATSSDVYAPLGSAATSLLSWDNPVSNDEVTVGFKQPVKANDALRTGTYAKTLTFTLSTTNP
ncbi:immune inhibitor A [Solirubrobacter sp. CPCC 204708]|uniref:Immune inhibitor A n=1 Tax=Solirubrobacter deserti TaxID=2282478 RepID=A0ABT4RRS4_9ACTN|nr:immune inhibitor A domain-containing protein [Solirubrobacter deserti]MBE2317594.1 immune inhibitor A [Solirubrobacter deserti]MDA0141288.1 immune inhibitor A [Solirubrobacter deserti]